MQPDRGHVHHRLIDLGFDQKQTVVILLITSGLLSLSAVVLLLCGAPRAIVLILAVVFVSAVGIKLAKNSVIENETLTDKDKISTEDAESENDENEQD